MRIFSMIMDAISWKRTRTTHVGQTYRPALAPAAAVPAAQATPLDVEASLDELGYLKPLNWRTSIVDMMKLIGVNSSLSNRKELAQELGYTGDLDGSAEMNIWLLKATMRKLAENGGKVPAELLA